MEFTEALLLTTRFLGRATCVGAPLAFQEDLQVSKTLKL